MIKNSNQNGMITPLVLITSSIFIIFGVALIGWSVTNHKSTIRKIRQTQSLQVAEAGVNYYKWHLTHNSSDYKDGNTWCCDEGSIPEKTLSSECDDKCGPYVHSYKDHSGVIIGQFSLEIIPSKTGSTINTIESTGYAYGNNSVQKKITSVIGKRSLAEYSFLSHSPIWIGSGEATSGPLHSNGGIKFDDTCDAEVTSAVLTYSCSGVGHDCGNDTKPGVWGAGGPTTLWRFPVAPIDFSLFTVDLANIKVDALSGGTYFGGNARICGNGTCGIMEDEDSCSADCSDQCGNGNCQNGETYHTCPKDCPIEGYLVRFNSEGTFNIYKINSLENKVEFRDYELGGSKWEAEQISSGPSALEQVGGDYDIPVNGLIFVEDEVWVEGTVKGKVTLVAARLDGESSYARIRINDNINYINYPEGERTSGTHNLGLIAQGDILVPRHAPDNLTIDATLLSQNGHVYVRNYRLGYRVIKNNIEIYGGIITNLFWTWSYVSCTGCPVINGYQTTNTIYNNNLLFNPPPSFPTTENFEVLSWDE